MTHHRKAPTSSTPNSNLPTILRHDAAAGAAESVFTTHPALLPPRPRRAVGEILANHLLNLVRAPTPPVGAEAARFPHWRFSPTAAFSSTPRPRQGDLRRYLRHSWHRRPDPRRWASACSRRDKGFVEREGGESGGREEGGGRESREGGRPGGGRSGGGRSGGGRSGGGRVGRGRVGRGGESGGGRVGRESREGGESGGGESREGGRVGREGGRRGREVGRGESASGRLRIRARPSVNFHTAISASRRTSIPCKHRHMAAQLDHFPADHIHIQTLLTKLGKWDCRGKSMEGQSARNLLCKQQNDPYLLQICGKMHSWLLRVSSPAS
ncbi:hypothetical protein H6P81_019068 [Aristolochia fimbriata]|uniref:Uncharacterized protein n=1 Tax=Aristolochia fimbriata TaxID=158543 RepID=A0AAV7E4V4_ARIFI|nr:hypothetical protein H6P81_019068 [Aristolochia fimbriata]